MLDLATTRKIYDKSIYTMSRAREEKVRRVQPSSRGSEKGVGVSHKKQQLPVPRIMGFSYFRP